MLTGSTRGMKLWDIAARKELRGFDSGGADVWRIGRVSARRPPRDLGNRRGGMKVCGRWQPEGKGELRRQG